MLRIYLAAFFLMLLGSVGLAAEPKNNFHIVIMIGEDEYKTWVTLPEFAKTELEPSGFRVTIIQAGPKDKNNFPGLVEALRDADLLFISIRRRAPFKEQLDAVRAHLNAGKPLVGIRTACHAFAPQGTEKERLAAGSLAEWPAFDPEVLGGHYAGHYGPSPKVAIEIAPGAGAHPILQGIEVSKMVGNGSLYKVRPLAETALPLLLGAIPDKPSEPVAWTRLYGPGKARIFYTSLGHPDDFKNPEFRRLLVNGIRWTLDSAGIRAALPNDARPAVNSGANGSSQARPQKAQAKEPPSEAPAGSKPLSPAQSLKQFSVADDLEIELVLAEPIVAQPVFLNFDERGRMWVVQYRQYPAPAGLKMVSHDSVWRSVYDKVPPAPPNHFPGLDKITIHEDTHGDGVFDKHTTFVEGLNIVTAVERGRGGVWVLNPPYLLFYPDKNGDDIPDGDPVVHLSGFGLEDTHSVVNSLRWGPDGWLYAAQGSTVTGHMMRPGLDKEPFLHTMGQLIWRYHPETRRLEVFAEGGGNAFGTELDAKGRIFSGHNGGDTRGFHYVQGGYLQKGFEKHGPLSNPFAFGYFPPMPNNNAPRFTHNFILYDGGALPDHYLGKLFGVEPLQGRVVWSDITPDKSSFRTKDLGHVVTSEDRWFRPVDIKVGPEGAIYVCDWYDQQVNHYRNYQGKMDPANGRIYRIKARGAKPGRPFDLSKLPSSQLVALLGHTNKWFRQSALRLLADRKDQTVIPKLTELVSTAAGQTSLEALWALYLSGGLTEPAALKALEHPDPFIRLWTARLLCDENKVSPRIAQKLIQLARSEDNLEARNQLACSARRLPVKECLAMVRNLLEHDEDATDNRMPLLLWWAIESKAEADREAVLALFENSPLWTRPLVKAHILERVMRRYAQAGTRKDLLTCARLFDLAPAAEQTKPLMAGFEAAFKGRPMTGLPDELVRAMARHGAGSIALRLRQGEAEAIHKALETIADEKAKASQRAEYAEILGELKVPSSVPVLLQALESSPNHQFRKAALSALQPYDDPKIAERIVALYTTFDKESLVAAQSLLASRPSSSWELVKAVEAGRIKPEAVPLNVVRKLKLYKDEKLVHLAENIWGNTGVPSTAEMEKQITRLSGVLRGGTGNPYRGRTLFGNSCAACHNLFGLGGQIGPNLTTYQRTDLENMLLQIVNPSAQIREGYETYNVETKDGRSLTGFLADKDNQIVVLRGLDGQNVAIARKDLLEMKASGLSLMPEGLLDALADEQVRDLFAYLRSSQPLVGQSPD